ncbi:hypothetical protein VTK56DRAFT_6288 [Thermocarpiscus australiensis]
MSYTSRHPPTGANGQRRDYRNGRDTRNGNRPSQRDGYRPPPYGGHNDYYSTRHFREGAPPPPSPSMSYPGPPGRDNYRPPQGDFTFRVDKPAGVLDSDTYRPQNNRNARNDRRRPPSPRREPHAAKRARGQQDRGPQNGNVTRPRQQDRPERTRGGRTWRPFIAAGRELLSANHNTGTELAFYNTENGVTYRPVEDLSDSEEAEMDISGDEAEAPAEPSNKRARVSLEQSASDNNTPKWSNPDPYTALPPETTIQAKKKDVVQMIRKARVQANTARAPLPSEAAEFISLDFDDSDASDDSQKQKEEQVPSKAATTAAASSSATSASAGRQLPAIARPDASVLSRDPTDSALGSRKRTHDDQIKMPHAKLKKANKERVRGHITSEWVAVPDLVPTPWMKVDHSRSANMAVWLHKEIVDFYDYIKPRDFEERMRSELVQELKKFCRQVFRDGEVYPFGSYPSGLYLPTADMDMVFMSDKFAAGGAAKYATKAFLHRFKAQLIRYNMAWENEIELILHAKVPLVKFVERKTGLKVDVSFENKTGLTAIGTFKAWRDQYPGMPALVTLIKHFLLMRGLNEPVNGGIGGFSVICLVVSMLQMMPEVQSGNLDTRHHLGQLLLHFFDLYGNKFNYPEVAISLNPPCWIPKHRVTTFTYKANDRLSIIDPNNPENDIAGGSSNAGTVTSLFADAHRELTRRMAQLAQDPSRHGQSILGVILGGNYSSFQKQRDYLELLARQGSGQDKKQPAPRKASKGKNGESRKKK